MDDIQKSIQERQQAQKMNILKGFVDFNPTSSEVGDSIEKAREVGETKTGADGITRIWTDRGNGSYGWRRVRKNGSAKSETGKTKMNADPNKPYVHQKDKTKLYNVGKDDEDDDEPMISRSEVREPDEDEAKAERKINSSSGGSLPKVGSTVKLKYDISLTSLSDLKGKSLKIIGYEDSGLISQPKFLKVEDENSKEHSLNPEYVNEHKKASLSTKNKTDISEKSFDEFKNEMIDKFKGYKLRESFGIGGNIISFSRHVRGEDSSFDIQEQNNENTAGKYYVNMLTKKEVSSRSLADPSKNYQTTSARVVKHKKTHTRKYANTLEEVEKIVNSHIKKIDN